MEPTDTNDLQKEIKSKKPKLTDKLDFEEQFKLIKNEATLE